MNYDYCYTREMYLRKRKAERTREIYSNIAGICFSAIIILGLGWAFVHSYTNQEQTYAIASENGNGIHYEYVTDKVCEVTEIKGNLVTVEYKGNLYSFYGTGFELNEKIVCTFNSADEIINAK